MIYDTALVPNLEFIDGGKHIEITYNVVIVEVTKIRPISFQPQEHDHVQHLSCNIDQLLLAVVASFR